MSSVQAQAILEWYYILTLCCVHTLHNETEELIATTKTHFCHWFEFIRQRFNDSPLFHSILYFCFEHFWYVELRVETAMTFFSFSEENLSIVSYTNLPFSSADSFHLNCDYFLFYFSVKICGEHWTTMKIVNRAQIHGWIFLQQYKWYTESEFCTQERNWEELF